MPIGKMSGCRYMLTPTSHSNKSSNNRSEKVVQSSTDEKQQALCVERRRASVLTVQDLIRHALAQGSLLSEITSFDVQPLRTPTAG